MDDLDEARTPWSERLLSPYTIAVALLLAVVGTCQGNELLRRWEREREERELAPLRAEWDAIRAEALPAVAAIEAALQGGAPAAEGGCADLRGTITIVNQGLLAPLAAGERFVRKGPHWLNSDAWLALTEWSTPGGEVELTRRRNANVRSALARPCVGVFEPELAEGTRLVDERHFEGGEVAGRLRIVCVDRPRVACETAVVSAPFIAIGVVQRDPRGQADHNTRAVTDSAERSYRRRLGERLAELAPGLEVEWEAPRS